MTDYIATKNSHPVPRMILLYWDISRKSVIHFDLALWFVTSTGFDTHRANTSMAVTVNYSINAEFACYCNKTTMNIEHYRNVR